MHVVPQCLQGAALKINNFFITTQSIIRNEEIEILEEMLCMVPQCLVQPLKQGITLWPQSKICNEEIDIPIEMHTCMHVVPCLVQPLKQSII